MRKGKTMLNKNACPDLSGKSRLSSIKAGIAGKKLLILLVFSVNIFGQINFSEFPKIGYGDMFLTANSPLYYNNHPHYQTYNNYLADDFYYPQLRELGLQ